MVAQERREGFMLNRSAAPAPESSVGADAVGRSRRDAALANAPSRAAMEASRAALADSLDQSIIRQRSGIAPTQRVGGRVFILRDGKWIDFRHTDSLRTVRVQPFSAAYVTLLKALPELVQPAQLGAGVLVAGRRVSIEIGEGGLDTWGRGEMEKVVREFRN
jgi:hypothetical protein